MTTATQTKPPNVSLPRKERVGDGPADTSPNLAETSLAETSQAPHHKIVLAAGGTGGHLFPAEALAAELRRRGHEVTLLTDARSGALSSAVFATGEVVVLPGAGIAGRGLLRGSRALWSLARGMLEARTTLRRLHPAVIVGFGGYPSIGPVLAARTLRGIRPAILLHEQNGVLGRANRVLARFADRLALGMAATRALPARPPAVITGNPVRPAIQAAAGQEYEPPDDQGDIRLLVTGGSLGARVFSDALPAAIGLLNPQLRARLRIVQQCRPEDLPRVQSAYAAIAVQAQLSPFFPDMAAQLLAAHFVVARAGASTVAEIAAIGRPALLVPLPGAIDGHQAYNAASVDADVMEQAAFEREPAVLAEALTHAFSCPDMLAMKAHAVAEHGRPRAAQDLADLVETLAAQGEKV